MSLPPGQRITLTKRIGEALQQQDLPNIDLTLDTFEVPSAPPPEETWESQKYEYVLRRLVQAGGPILVELHAHLYPDAPDPSKERFDPEAAGAWREGYFRLFLSHTHPHKILAAAIKEVLADYGIDVFVAHDMIEPTREWQDEIETALGTCDALAALWTPDFIESRWCDQEVGIAMGRGRLIVAIRQGADPHGFIGKYQAVTGDTSGIGSGRTIARRILDALWASDMTRGLVARPAVVAYAKSISFEEARIHCKRVLQLGADEWSEDLVEMAEEAGKENRQLEEGLWLERGADYNKPIPQLLSAHLDSLLKRSPPPEPSDFQSASTGATEDNIPF